MLSHGPEISNFFERYLRHPKGRGYGTPFVLERWQQQFVNEFYRVDEKGERVYRLGILGIPRGNGKSPLAAGFGLYELLSSPGKPEIFCAAGSKEQAAIVQDFARGFVEASELRKLGVHAGRKAITYERGGVMRMISSAGSLQHGLMPKAAIADELHAFTTNQQEETWTALQTALHKVDNAYGLIITTSGFDKNTLLGRMYDEALLFEDGEDRGPCLRIRRDLENGVLFWWYGIPEELEHRWEDETLWLEANPASWLRMEDLRALKNAPGADELDFRRLHLNMWTRSRVSWLPSGCWAGLAGDEHLKAGDKIFVGVDVGWYHDSTAVVWASRLPSGKIGVWSKVWTTHEDQLGELVPGGRMKLELVEAFILERLKPNYRIAEVVYDPAYFGRSAELLERRGMKMIEMPPQHAQTTEAWQSFYQAACEGRLTHDGDPVLSAHVESAGVEMTVRGPKVRKTKSTSRIDALAAAVLAHARCDLKTRPGKRKPSVFFFDPDM